MKTIITIVTLSLLLTACSRQGVKLSKQIVGTWQSKGAGTASFNPDASFLINERTSTQTNAYAGTWRIRDMVMTLTFTNVAGSAPEVLAGNTIDFKIIRVDAHHFIYTVSGVTNSCNR